MIIKPPSRPAQQRSITESTLVRNGVIQPVALLGVRGYYQDTMGQPGVNDRGIYDDAIFLISPAVHASFNANTDPSRIRKGSGKGRGKGMAVLKKGLWLYKPGLHGLTRPNPYQALVQADAVTVIRDGNPPYPDTGYFGINIHRGGNTTTSSEGCQTIFPAQWTAFIELVRSELKRAGQKTIPYLLIES